MLKGILAVIAGSLIFGVEPSGNNYVLMGGMSASCLLFYQALVMSIASFGLAYTGKNTLHISKRDISEIAGIGFLGIYLTSLFLNIAYTHLTVSMTILLNFLYPTVVLIISATLFHERVTMRHVLAIALGFAGLICVLDFSRTDADLTGMMFALLSGICYAVYCVANERSRVGTFPLPVRLFYMSVTACIIAAIQTVGTGTFMLPADRKTAAIIVFVIGIGCVSAYGLVLYGIRGIGAGRAAVINMLEPVAAVFFGILFFREPLTKRMIAGGVFILLSILLVALESRVSDKEGSM